MKAIIPIQFPKLFAADINILPSILCEAVFPVRKCTPNLCCDSPRVLRPKRRRNLVVVAIVQVQQLEAIRHRCKSLLGLGQSRLLSRFKRGLRIRLCTLIDIEVDLFAFVSPGATVSLAADKRYPMLK